MFQMSETVMFHSSSLHAIKKHLWEITIYNLRSSILSLY